MIFTDKSNTQLSKLSERELKEYKEFLSEYYIDYRESLNLDDNIQFGIEIEYDDFPKVRVDDFFMLREPNWTSTYETSLPFGGEAVSPILKDNKSSWDSIKEVCEFLRIAGANESESAGAHIHVCADIIGTNVYNWEKLIKLIMAYENVLYRFSAGEYTRLRDNFRTVCPPIALDLLEYYLEKKDADASFTNIGIMSMLNKSRFQSFNFRNLKLYNIYDRVGKNTIEFRFPNATLEPIIWQNNINTFVRFLLASKNEIDDEYVDYRIDKLYDHYDDGFYDYIDEEGALHFADQVFNNDLDKAAFLREYYKDFSTIGPYTPYKLTKRFINN